MKILFAIKNMDTAKGGAERVLAQVSSGLAERDHDIALMTFDKGSAQSYYPLHKNIKRIGLGIGDALRKASLSETIQRIRAARKVLKQEKPDVAIAFMHSMFIPLSIAAIGTRVPVIASEHIVPAHYKSRPFEFLLLIISSFLVPRMTAVSKAVRRSYPALVRRKMVVVPNPVHIHDIKQKSEDNERRVILNVGRLDEQKDQRVLILAFAKLANQLPDWDVKIFGEGPLEGALKNLIQELHLQDRVFLMGTTKDIGAQYGEADIFAMPSKYESFGLATAEALSCGVPAIGFKECPGTNELIIAQENGLLVSKDKRDALEAYRQGLEMLMQDESLRKRLAQNAPASISQYKLEAIISQWDALIRQIAAS